VKVPFTRTPAGTDGTAAACSPDAMAGAARVRVSADSAIGAAKRSRTLRKGTPRVRMGEPMRPRCYIEAGIPALHQTNVLTIVRPLISRKWPSFRICTTVPARRASYPQVSSPSRLSVPKRPLLSM
jgi:hypothetical protein